MRKKSNNPFKMVGAWVGFGIPSLLLIYVWSSLCKANFMCGNNLHKISYFFINFLEEPNIFISGILALGSIGFLIGWLITIIYRKVSK